MMRKIIAGALSLITTFFATLSILAIWDIIEVQHVLSKSLSTLVVLFVASAIILVIFAILVKPENDQRGRHAPSGSA